MFLAIECEDLDNPLNGEVVVVGNFVFNSIATYSCQSGHKLIGTATRVCQENGQWSAEEPVCRSMLSNQCGVVLTSIVVVSC